MLALSLVLGSAQLAKASERVDLAGSALSPVGVSQDLHQDVKIETDFFTPVSTADVADSSELTEWLDKNAERLGLFEGSAPQVQAKEQEIPAGMFHPVSSEQIHVVRVRDSVAATGAAATGVAEIAGVIEEMNFARSCTQMASARGYGPTGQVIARMLGEGSLPNLIEGSPDLTRACPAYGNLNLNQKKMVWVTVFTAMAHLESSCNNSRTARGPNGRLRGLWQLHDGFEHRYAAGCRRGDSTSASGNAACSARMLDAQMARAGALFSRDSYWGVLRPQGEPRPGGGRRIMKARVIIRALGELSICRAR